MVSSHPPLFSRMLVVAAVTLMLGGCVGVAVGAGATVGAAAYQERGVDGVARDLKITADVRERLFRFDHELAAAIGLEVYEGRVLVTGTVDEEKDRADAVRLAWQAPGVKEVINEVQVVDADLVDLTRDTWITTKLEARITFDKHVSAVNYSVETVNRTIYLIGIAQNQEELDRVIAHARDIEKVRHVISHVRVKTSP